MQNLAAFRFKSGDGSLGDGPDCFVESWVQLIICLSICAGYILVLLLVGSEGGRTSGWVVSDGVTLLRSSIDDSRISVSEIFESYHASAGLAVVLSRLTGLHPILPVLLNVLVVSICMSFVGDTNRSDCGWSSVLLLLTPYYLCAMVLPSKDILVLGLFALIAREVRSFSLVGFLRAISISAAMFFVRDGFSAILCFACLVAFLMHVWQLRWSVVLLPIIFASSTFWQFFDIVLEDSFIYARAVAVAGESSYADASASPTIGSYFVRLAGNMTNLAFRPVLFDVYGGISVVSVAYWISGLTLLTSLILFLRGARSRVPPDRVVGVFGLVVVAVVSITPYVQPRYLLPLILLTPGFSFINVGLFFRIFGWVSAVSLIAALVYMSFGIYPPAAEVLPFSYGALSM